MSEEGEKAENVGETTEEEKVGSIHVSREGRVATVEIHAPWRCNSVDTRMLKALTITLNFLAEDIADRAPDAPRCVILRGTGKHFSTGFYLPELLAQVNADVPITNLEHHPLETAVRALDSLPCPTIAMVTGHALGAGCELALTCDMRMVAEEAVFGMPPAKLGILYSITGMRRLVEIVGLPLAKEMLFSANRISGERTLAVGLANHRLASAELEKATAKLAKTIAGNAPLAVNYTKSVLNDYLRTTTDLRDNDRRRIDAMRRHCFHSEDFQAAITAVLKKEAVEFKGE